MEPGYLVIAGVTKSATTSLFSYLAQHPDICPSEVKETYHFLPARFDEALSPLADYERYFRHCAGARVRMEASPGYFYGGPRLAEAIDSALPDVRVVVSFRDPVDRLLSFFHFHKEKALLPPDMRLSEYVSRAGTHTTDDLRKDRALERWTGVAGGQYGAYFPDWARIFGDRLHVVWFDDLRARPILPVSRTLEAVGLPRLPEEAFTFSVENATVRPRFGWLHRAALRANQELEPFLHRHRRAKALVRRVYQKVNTEPRSMTDVDVAASDLRAIFQPSLSTFRGQVLGGWAKASDLPVWLAEA